MTFALADFGHGTLTMDGVPALGSRELLVILVRYSTRMPDGSVDTPELPHEAKFYEDLVFANPFGSTPAGPIPYVRNVEHYYRAMSGGRFGWVKAGVVGPVVLSEDESKKDGGLRQRIVQIVRNRGLFNFSVYNVPGEARVAGKRNIIDALCF